MIVAQPKPLAETPEGRKVAFICSKGTLDMAYPALVMGWAALGNGIDVTIFFTFWGLNTIRRKGASSSAKDWLRRMFGLLNKGGADSLPLSRFHFWGLGTKMMQRVMKQNRMPGVPELIETALDLGVHFIACTTTMGLMGITKDTLIEGIDQFAGVTTYLAEAKQGSVNLFI